MAAILASREVGVRKLGSVVDVPVDYTARLMYYLNSVCNALDLSDNEATDKLRNYAEYYEMSEDEIDVLVELCFNLSPSELIGKDDELCGDSNNKFYELSSVRRNILLTDSVLVGGQTRAVRRVMFFKPAWVVQNWLDPMKHFANRLIYLNSGMPGTAHSDADDGGLDADDGADVPAQSCCTIS